MSDTITGFVKKVNSKSSPPGAKRAWTAWSVKIEDKEGNELPQWFRFGFDKPSIEEGQYVRFDCKELNDQYGVVDVASLRISKTPPERTEAAKAKSAATGGGSGGGYNSEEQRADRGYHSARGSAIEVVQVLLENKALPMSTAAGKGGAAKRYEEILAAVDKVTVKYFRDEFPEFTGTFRLLDYVDDEGAITAGNTKGLPDDSDPEEEDEGEELAEFPEEDEGF